MKKIKKFWGKNLRNKGIVIGTIFGVFIVAINIISYIRVIRVQSLYDLSGLLIQPVTYITFNLFGGCDELFCLALILPTYLFVPVFYGLIGFFIGYLIEKSRRTKPKKKGKKNKFYFT